MIRYDFMCPVCGVFYEIGVDLADLDKKIKCPAKDCDGTLEQKIVKAPHFKAFRVY